MKKEFIGIDISKNKIDVCTHGEKAHKVFENHEEGYKAMLVWLNKTVGKSTGLAFCIEHTGKYDVNISLFFEKHSLDYYKVSGLAVKRSAGIKRGKNDKVDARGLARYAYLLRDELQPYKMAGEKMRRLKQLVAHRAKLVRQRAAHKTSLSENKKVLGEEADPLVIQSSQDTIDFLSAQVKTVELAMDQIVKEEQTLQKNHGLLTSINGVGNVIAINMLVATNNFQSFDNARKFACFAGIAPFEHTSGSSIKGRTTVSKLGNRTIKTLLSSAASIAIVHNKELKSYYHSRLEKGKNKRSTLNIIRNKIVQRMFAVVKRETPFVDLHKFAA